MAVFEGGETKEPFVSFFAFILLLGFSQFP